MSKLDKDADLQEPAAQTPEEGAAPKGAARPKAETRAWAAVNKLAGGNKKFDARRKVPSGPLGGSGRKTNLSRSS
ncbi:MAG: hypothetical protein ACK4PH_04315 [Aquincola tertiaricarbonis]|uniref:hypothetical protein n=1 Tax=Aquincola sp. J276 TaxID=2898432 RepID=UPI002150743F|nr:hypothetical protein [Aquincola sp. J276]MCR5868534.1 hypothetical protein [Aquincola sp. J276]